VRLWDLRSGKLQHTFSWHALDVTSLVFTPDSRNLISSDGSAQTVWNVTSPAEPVRISIAKKPVPPDQNGIDFQKTVVSPDGSHHVRLWKQNPRPGPVGGWQLYDVASGDLKYSEMQRDHGLPEDAIFSPDGKTILLELMDRLASIDRRTPQSKLEIREVPTGKLLQTHRPADYAGGLIVSPDGKLWAGFNSQSAISLWDVATGSLERQLKGPAKSQPYHRFSQSVPRLLNFSPDVRLVIGTGPDNEVSLWSVGQ
jgi:WD40 repeat protein